jgi:beta-xylosidase
MLNKANRLYVFLWLTIISLFGLCTACNSGGHSPVAPANTYLNPVGDSTLRMGDPFVMQHDGKYYLYGTAGRDGFKCWSSDNLRDWTYEGYAFQETADSFGESNYWAPEVIHYQGKFYMTYSCKPKDEAAYPDMMLICLAESDSPTGPFTDKYAPWIDQGYSCIDAHIFVDDDTQPYVYFDRVGYIGKWPDGYMFGIIYAMQLDQKSLQPTGDTVRIAEAQQEWENPQSDFSRCNEGAFVFKENGKYYLTYSANHWRDPFYGIGYATSDHPLGPWTKPADNPLVAKDSLRGIFGPGHNSFTRSPDGKELFMVYHTHVSHEDKDRTVNIDRVSINEAGKLEIEGPTREPQPLPSGVE